MRTISLLIVKVLAVIVANISFLWVIIEFILYLVKDKSFNWWSVYTFIISVVVALAIVIYASVVKVKASKKRLNDLIGKPRKSKFQQKLDEAMSKANTQH